MAAAAAFSSSRASKGLFLIFTLLSLICFSSSFIDKNQLDQLKENLEKMQKRSDRMKEDLTDLPNTSAFLDDSIDMLDQLIAYMKKTNTFPHDFPQLETYAQKAKGFAKESKAFVDRTNEELGGEMQENENNLEKLKKMVKFLEENQAEL